MAVIAAGARYDPVSQTVQSIVLITDDDGKGHPHHLNPHKLHAGERGHQWIDIPKEIYNTFTCPEDLFAHISKKVGITVGVDGFSVLSTKNVGNS